MTCPRTHCGWSCLDRINKVVSQRVVIQDLERQVAEVRRLQTELEGMRERFAAAQADALRWAVRVGALEDRLRQIREVAK